MRLFSTLLAAVAIAVTFYLQRLRFVPSVALYAVESTFQRGFDSFRAYHLTLYHRATC